MEHSEVEEMKGHPRRKDQLHPSRVNGHPSNSGACAIVHRWSVVVVDENDLRYFDRGKRQRSQHLVERQSIYYHLVQFEVIHQESSRRANERRRAVSCGDYDICNRTIAQVAHVVLPEGDTDVIGHAMILFIVHNTS